MRDNLTTTVIKERHKRKPVKYWVAYNRVRYQLWMLDDWRLFNPNEMKEIPELGDLTPMIGTIKHATPKVAEMKTELVTNGHSPIHIKWSREILLIQEGGDVVACELSEAIELRDFLIQLNLGK